MMEMLTLMNKGAVEISAPRFARPPLEATPPWLFLAHRIRQALFLLWARPNIKTSQT